MDSKRTDLWLSKSCTAALGAFLIKSKTRLFARSLLFVEWTIFEFTLIVIRSVSS
jgi:hypothetical protein